VRSRVRAATSARERTWLPTPDRPRDRLPAVARGDVEVAAIPSIGLKGLQPLPMSVAARTGAVTFPLDQVAPRRRRPKSPVGPARPGRRRTRRRRARLTPGSARHAASPGPKNVLSCAHRQVAEGLAPPCRSDAVRPCARRTARGRGSLPVLMIVVRCVGVPSSSHAVAAPRAGPAAVVVGVTNSGATSPRSAPLHRWRASARVGLQAVAHRLVQQDAAEPLPTTTVSDRGAARASSIASALLARSRTSSAARHQLEAGVAAIVSMRLHHVVAAGHAWTASRTRGDRRRPPRRPSCRSRPPAAPRRTDGRLRHLGARGTGGLVAAAPDLRLALGVPRRGGSGRVRRAGARDRSRASPARRSAGCRLPTESATRSSPPRGARRRGRRTRLPAPRDRRARSSPDWVARRAVVQVRPKPCALGVHLGQRRRRAAARARWAVRQGGFDQLTRAPAGLRQAAPAVVSPA